MSSEKMAVATIRIPKKLASDIDSHLYPEGHYSTRPDFITTAVKLYTIKISDLMFNVWTELEEESDSDRMYYYEEAMEKILSDAQVEYARYTGKPITVLIRVSPKLIESYEEIRESGPEFLSFQNFVRASIPYLLNLENRSVLMRPLMRSGIEHVKETMKDEGYEAVDNLIKNFGEPTTKKKNNRK